ncbi:MAG: hypothetical protein LUG61_00300 [Lachnospiraceae bacterium]|nr:hypothetical protein [Lachnospiraceae bacterium]
MLENENLNHDTQETQQPAPQGVHGDHGYHSARVKLQPGSGITVGENGEIIMKFKACPGDEVIAAVGNDNRNPIRVPMTDEEGNGIFTAVLENHGLVGPQMINFSVNGLDVLNTSASQLWYLANALHNYVELPDPETDALIEARRDIAHGSVTHDFYYSETYDKWMNCTVYTPPDYEQGGEYPVLYFFHECAENETAWTPASLLNFELDNLIADGKIVPFLMVELDCTVPLNYHNNEDWFAGYDKIEQFLLKDIISFMETKYRVRKDKWDRAISGIGLGAVQAAYIGMRNTDVFGSIGMFTAFWISSFYHAEGKDDPFYTAAEKIAAHPEEVKVFYHSEGDLDPHFRSVEAENEMFALLGIDKLPGYVFKVYHASHNWSSYRRSMRDFAPLLFRD